MQTNLVLNKERVLEPRPISLALLSLTYAAEVSLRIFRFRPLQLAGDTQVSTGSGQAADKSLPPCVHC